jgi:hypothetical protein
MTDEAMSPLRRAVSNLIQTRACDRFRLSQPRSLT